MIAVAADRGMGKKGHDDLCLQPSLALEFEALSCFCYDALPDESNANISVFLGTQFVYCHHLIPFCCYYDFVVFHPMHAALVSFR